MLWERRISHPGLKAVRVIRGANLATVELMAKFQLEKWEERWRKIQAANVKKQKEDKAAELNFQKKELALKRTREAEQAHKAITQILRDGIEIDHVVDWESLKDRSPFSEPKPQGPEPLLGSPPPEQTSSPFLPHFTAFDWIVPGRRARKIDDARHRFREARHAWVAKRTGDSRNKCSATGAIREHDEGLAFEKNTPRDNASRATR
jgi:restriction system protein